MFGNALGGRENDATDEKEVPFSSVHCNRFDDPSRRDEAGIYVCAATRLGWAQAPVWGAGK